jgi:hypothetical protein
VGLVKKPKKATIEFIEREINGMVAKPYRIMERLVATKRADLAEAQIGFAWRLGWKRDKDGLLKCGKCCKRNELDRNLSRFDFVILLNAEAWATFTDRQKERLIFHELEHAQIVTEDEMPKRDEKGRLVTRCKKHDIQDFRSVVEEYGWDEDLSDLAIKGIADADRPLLQMAEGSAKPGENPQSAIHNPQSEESADDAEPQIEDPFPDEDDGVDPATGTPGVYRIPIAGTKKMSFEAMITVHRDEDNHGWRYAWSADAGRHPRPAGDKSGVYPTSQIAAEEACKELVAWLEAIPEKQYGYGGAAITRVKQAVAKWIGAMPEA